MRVPLPAEKPIKPQRRTGFSSQADFDLPPPHAYFSIFAGEADDLFETSVTAFEVNPLFACLEGEFSGESHGWSPCRISGNTVPRAIGQIDENADRVPDQEIKLGLLRQADE
jgi:hypothetical protein